MIHAADPIDKPVGNSVTDGALVGLLQINKTCARSDTHFDAMPCKGVAQQRAHEKQSAVAQTPAIL
jgi:hypothetical protein